MQSPVSASTCLLTLTPRGHYRPFLMALRFVTLEHVPCLLLNKLKNNFILCNIDWGDRNEMKRHGQWSVSSGVFQWPIRDDKATIRHPQLAYCCGFCFSTTPSPMFLPVLLSYNLMCLFSWAVMLIGRVGWLMTLFIWQEELAAKKKKMKINTN